ncbi:MAG TPA: S41 family peptidase [Blastocatellia bacterium]|nr:S41 family peptidase [Blastocatellia bacterium]
MSSFVNGIRGYAIILLLTVFLSGAGIARPVSAKENALGSPRAALLTPRERADVFDDVWEIVNEKYYDPAFNGVNWRAVRERYRPQIDQVDGDQEFYGVLKRMVGELHDAHTRFSTPEERRERERLQAVSAGFAIFEVEGKPVVVWVEPNSDAARAGVEEGMIALTIDGKPIAEKLAEARARVAGSSTDRAVRLRIYRMLIEGEPGTSLRLTLARADGSTVDALVTRRVVPDAPVVTSRRLPSGAGYIKLTLWKSPIRRDFKKALRQLADAPGIVIDLRGNPGGEAEEVEKIATYFFNSHVSLGKFFSRSGKAIYLRTGDDEEVYKGRVVILVNEGSGSGSELFAGVMQESKRATIVGRRSCGCVLGISKYRKLKGGGELAVSEYGYQTPQGKTFEGTGVVPNSPVELTISDLRQHRDAALEEAERVLKTKGETRTLSGSNPRSSRASQAYLG